MSTPNSQTDILTVTEIAEILEVNEESVRRWIRENKLAANKKLGRIGHTIYLNALVDFVNSSSRVYQKKLIAWLRKKNISFEFTKSGAGIPASVAAAVGTTPFVGTLATGVVGYMMGANPSKITLANQTDPDIGAIAPYEQPPAHAEGPQIQTDAEWDSSAGGDLIEAENEHVAVNIREDSYDDLMKEALLERFHQKKAEISTIYLQQEEFQRELAKLEVRLKIAQNELTHCKQELELFYKE